MFTAWEEFKVIKNTYPWKHLYFPPGLYRVFITASWQRSQTYVTYYLLHELQKIQFQKSLQEAACGQNGE